MDEFDKQEFWKALGRLYDSSVKLLEIATKHESRLDKLEVVQQWLAEKEREREKRERGE